MRKLAVLAALFVVGCDPAPEPKAPVANPGDPQAKQASAPIYGFEEMTIDGDKVSMSRYQGKVLLIVNVASKCGYTPQYEGLEKMFATHEDDGFFVLGFPSDQFGHQEPGTEKDIKTFCTTLYGVKFPMFAKVDVNGPNANPLYQYLRAQQPGSFDKNAPGADKLYAHLEKSTPEVLGTDAIKWNFTKFLVDRQGKVVRRFESYETPESIEPEVAKVIAQK